MLLKYVCINKIKFFYLIVVYDAKRKPDDSLTGGADTALPNNATGGI